MLLYGPNVTEYYKDHYIITLTLVQLISHYFIIMYNNIGLDLHIRVRLVYDRLDNGCNWICVVLRFQRMDITVNFYPFDVIIF